MNNNLTSQELKYQSMLNMLLATNATIDTIMTTLVTLLNIIFFISFTDGKVLLPAYTVFAIGFYMRLCNSMCFNFTRAMIYFSNFRVSAQRIGKFLNTPELDLDRVTPPSDPKLAFEVNDFSFSWSKHEKGFSLSNITLKIRKGNYQAYNLDLNVNLNMIDLLL